MAATEKKQIWFWASDSGVAPSVREYPIAASQGVFMPGAACYISTAGTVKLAVTTVAANAPLHGFIVGLANASSTWPITAEQAANTVVKVALCSTDQTWAAYAENGGSDTSCAQTLVGDQLGLTVSATATQIGYTTIDVNKATNVAVKVVGLASNVESEKFPLATSPGVLLVRVLRANIDASAA